MLKAAEELVEASRPDAEHQPGPDEVKARASALTAATAAGRQVRENVELMAKAGGWLRIDAVNVAVALLESSDWIGLRARILQALADEPTARAKVMAAIAPPGGQS